MAKYQKFSITAQYPAPSKHNKECAILSNNPK